MGNTSSNEPVEIKSLSTQIDDIAVHYILKQNTIDLLRLTDQEYYDNLVVLIGNVFQKRLTDMEIGSLNQRMFPETIQDVVLDLMPQGKTKELMIQNISRFYVKIMMVYSAIVSTIDPQYSYEDASGEKQLFYLKDIHAYKKIPRHAQPVVHQLTNPMNLCRKRISILRNKIDLTDPDFITINPGEKMCSADPAIRLTDEIGIQELDLLYYDVFDPETNSWKSRSPEMEAKYKRDLKTFYMSFTGKADMPETIRKFKDIELFDFRSLEYCKDPLFTHDFVVSKDDELIVRYKEQVELLEEKTTHYRNLLLTNLRKLFTAKSIENTLTYSIRSTLTLQEILVIEKDTRNAIIELYTQCEQYFIRALLIFEEIYDHQSKRMNESRIKNLDDRYQPLYQQEMLIAPLTPQNIEKNSDPINTETMNSDPKNTVPINTPMNDTKNQVSPITPVGDLNPVIPPVTIPAAPVYSTVETTPSPPAPIETVSSPPAPIETEKATSILSFFNSKKDPIPSPDPSPEASKLPNPESSPAPSPEPLPAPSPELVTPSPELVTPSPELVAPSPELVTPSPELVTPSPELVAPSPAPSPELVTPSPESSPAPSPELVTPSPELVTPSPEPSPELVTPLPEPSPELVTPSPELVTPSPELVTPSPELVTPSPELVTPLPAPSPELVTPSPELVTPSPELVTPSPAPSPELVTPSPELVTPSPEPSPEAATPQKVDSNTDPATNVSPKNTDLPKENLSNRNMVPNENKDGSTNLKKGPSPLFTSSKNIVLKKNIPNAPQETSTMNGNPILSNKEKPQENPSQKKETLVEKITNLFKSP